MFMKKIIPFKKDIIFKTNISEITSISLEHQLNIDNQEITGKFIVSGDYKISDNSKTVESFDYNLPFEIVLDDCYDTSDSVIDIDDFYYEIVNDKILSVTIDVRIDKIKEILIPNEIQNKEEKKDIIEELYEEQNNNNNEKPEEEKNINILYKNRLSTKKCNEERCVEENDILPGEEEIEKMDNKLKDEVILNKEETKEQLNDKINSIFNNIGDANVYVSYNVYIIREGDTIDSIIEKYETTEDELKKYNNLSDLKIGDKIIIPSK